MLENLPTFRRNLALVLIAALALWFAWSISAVLTPLLIGYLCAYTLHPMVEGLVRRGFSRRRAVNFIFLVGFVLAGGLVVGLWLQGARLAAEIANNEGLAELIAAKVEEGRLALEQQIRRFDPEFALPALPNLREWLIEQFHLLRQEQQAKLGQAGLAAAGGAWDVLKAVLGGVLDVLGFVFLVPLYTYFLLFELGGIHAFIARYLPREERARLTRVAEQMGMMLSSFFRGRLLVAFLKGAFLTVGLMASGMPYALLFGMGSGLASLIPFVGAAGGFALASLAGMLDHGLWGALVRSGIVFGLAEALENYVLIPKIIGQSMGLPLIVVLFALMAGAAALGFFGVVLALPLTAGIVILVREFVLPALERWAQE